MDEDSMNIIDWQGVWETFNEWHAAGNKADRHKDCCEQCVNSPIRVEDYPEDVDEWDVQQRKIEEIAESLVLFDIPALVKEATKNETN